MFRILLLSHDGIGQQRFKHRFQTRGYSEEKSMTCAIVPDVIELKRSNYGAYGGTPVALLSTRSRTSMPLSEISNQSYLPRPLRHARSFSPARDRLPFADRQAATPTHHLQLPTIQPGGTMLDVQSH